MWIDRIVLYRLDCHIRRCDHSEGGVSIAGRSKAEIVSRLRVTEAELVLAQVRITELERALEFYAEKTNWGDLPKFGTAANNDVLHIDEGHGWDVAETALHGRTDTA